LSSKQLNNNVPHGVMRDWVVITLGTVREAEEGVKPGA